MTKKIVSVGNLTDSNYWGKKQQRFAALREEVFWKMTDFEWLPVIEPYLRRYAGQRFVELGCSPGITSVAISKRVSFEFHGVDFSPESELYLYALGRAGIRNARLYQNDLREFKPDISFDVVASFGLLEHFTDIEAIFNHHDRLLRPGGLCVIVIPNFRNIPYLYHYLFNRSELRRHNLDSMHLHVFNKLALRQQHIIHFLGYVGKLRFWNVDLEGTRLARITKRILSKMVREAARWGGNLLPKGHPLLAPWIVYVAEKT